MTPTMVALTGLAFTVFVTVCGGFIFALKQAVEIGRMRQRLDYVERRPSTDNECARELAKISERLDGMAALFDEKINGLRELVHDGLKSRPHLRAVASKAKSSG